MPAASPRRRGSNTFRSLRTRNARRFFVGLTISNVGAWIQSTAMSLLVYRLTGKATDVGITLLAQFLPMLLLGVWAGALADRVDKRKMAIVTQSVMGVQAITIGVLELAGLVELWVVYAAALVLGIAGALDNPARRGYVVELVEPADIPNILALNTAVMTGSRIFGPALAAALIGPLGAGWLFIVNGITFLAILWPMITADESDLHRAPPAARGGRPVRDAIAFVAANPRLAHDVRRVHRGRHVRVQLRRLAAEDRRRPLRRREPVRLAARDDQRRQPRSDRSTPPVVPRSACATSSAASPCSA